MEPGGRWNRVWRYAFGSSVTAGSGVSPMGRTYAGGMPVDGPADLFEVARAVQANAHVPYSHFRVGAAVRGASGRIYAGCNVENASYPEGTSAEAVAIGAMVTAGETEIVEVLTIADGEHLTTPCGGCRQRIRELAVPGTPVHTAGPDGVRRTFTIEELLPASFLAENLDRF